MDALFLMLILDHDQRIFSVHGPMSDDADWTNRVRAAQRQGRNVTCSTNGAVQTREAAADAARDQFGYKQVASVSMD